MYHWMNIEYAGFLGLGFQGKNICVMFVFSIVYFMFFYWKYVCSKYCIRLKSTEMDSLVNNQTWDLDQLPVGKRALQNKWVYRLKEEDGGEKWYKARLVVKGFAQKKGIDFDEIFSPVVKMTSIRTILSLMVV